MIMLVLALLALPTAATASGLIVWAMYRGEALDDGDLVRNFLVVLTLCGLALYATSRTHPVRIRFDTVYRVKYAIEQHPLVAMLEREAEGSANQVKAALTAQMLNGATLNDALLASRPLLLSFLNGRLGFADQKSRVMWGRYVANTLAELRARDPQSCERAARTLTIAQEAPVAALSAENAAAFDDVFIALYESSNRGMRRERFPDDRPVEQKDAMREFGVVTDSVAARYGREIAEPLARREFNALRSALPGQVCPARILQLEQILKYPQPMAARLLDGALR